MSAAAELHAIYSRIPQMEGCDGSCAVACVSVPAGPGEAEQLAQAGARLTGPPMGELGIWPADGQLTAAPGHRCPVLDRATNRCTAYEARPAICRLYGAVPEMPCVRGCRPVGGVLRTSTARRILRAAMSVAADRTEDGG